MLVRTIFLPAIVLSLLTLWTPHSLSGQNPAGHKIQVNVKLTQDRVHDSSHIFAILGIAIQNGWHINSAHPSDESMIPTIVEPSPVKGISVSGIHYPTGEQVKFPYMDKPADVYSGSVSVVLNLWIEPGTRPGRYSLPVDITYQACNDNICVAPATLRVEVPFRVVPSNDPASPFNNELYDTFVKEFWKRRKVQ